MESREAIELFLSNGMQLDKKSLSYITEKRLDEQFLSEFISLQSGKDKRDVVVDDLVAFESSYRKAGHITVLKKSEPLPESISVEELVQDRMVTYDSIRKLLQYRWELVNPISINKIGRGSTKFSLIAEVVGLEKVNKTVTLQDNTGTVTASVATIEDTLLEQVDIGDTLGFLCESGARLAVTKIINPDTPLFRDKKKSSEKAALIFVCGLAESKKEAVLKDISKKLADKTARDYEKLYVFDFEDGPCDGKRVAEDSRDIFYITESVGDGSTNAALLSVCDTKVLVVGKRALTKTGAPTTAMTNVLRKRLINHQRICGTSISPFVIDPVPDVFVTNLGGGQQANYKNTILLSIDDYEKENTCWVIDLQTNECIKVNLE